MAGAQYAVSLEKFEPDMATHAEVGNLRGCIVDSSESELKEFKCSDFDINNRLLELVPL